MQTKGDRTDFRFQSLVTPTLDKTPIPPCALRLTARHNLANQNHYRSKPHSRATTITTNNKIPCNTPQPHLHATNHPIFLPEKLWQCTQQVQQTEAHNSIPSTQTSTNPSPIISIQNSNLHNTYRDDDMTPSIQQVHILNFKS